MVTSQSQQLPVMSNDNAPGQGLGKGQGQGKERLNRTTGSADTRNRSEHDSYPQPPPYLTVRYPNNYLDRFNHPFQMNYLLATTTTTTTTTVFPNPRPSPRLPPCLCHLPKPSIGPWYLCRRAGSAGESLKGTSSPTYTYTYAYAYTYTSTPS